ncbi:MAG: N-acetylmuramoyl-L-alanine amidase [Rhodobacteraceae bacterium]|nr:N-acetylmuramoyl-L-alanine amidase [Paracoccaceae bacterium]
MRTAIAALVLALVMVPLAPAGSTAQQLQALARLEARQSGITGRSSGDVDIRLKLTQAVPYRVFTLAGPARLVLDFREVNFAVEGLDRLNRTDRVTAIRTGLFRPGWSRMVLELASPMKVHSAAMRADPNDGDAEINIRLTPVAQDDFAASTGPGGDDDVWALPRPPDMPPAKTRPMGDRQVIVALDPGHGGIDPGAQYGGHDEADLMLTLARELKERLVLTGRYQVVLTRDEDVFLSLEGRVTAARAAGADVFLSLHADALATGRASGATIYTLSDTASDAAAEVLAANHDRADLLAGVDLSQQDDLVASILMDMARVETMPRAEKLADGLVDGIAAAVGQIRSRPRLSAGFSVLKAADIPSVLIEFGFMSNASDLSNLATQSWRAQVIGGIVAALDQWSLDDAAEARLLRQ